MSDRMMLAIDPGDKHVGLAWGDWDSRELQTEEKDAEVALAFIESRIKDWLKLRRRVTVVVERFVLYHGQDNKKSWNPMLTSEMIGAIKYMCSHLRVPVVEQPASIQKPTRGHMRARGIPQAGKGPHARSAELHWWCYRLHTHKTAEADDGEAS